MALFESVGYLVRQDDVTTVFFRDLLVQELHPTLYPFLNRHARLSAPGNSSCKRHSTVRRTGRLPRLQHVEASKTSYSLFFHKRLVLGTK